MTDSLPTTQSIQWSPCRGHLIPSIDANSTVDDVITPCFGHVFLPGLSASFIVTGFAFLIIYSKYLITAPSLQTRPLLITKLSISTIHFIIALTQAALNVPEWSAERELGFSSISNCFFSSFALLSFILCWRKGIIGSIWLHSAWVLHGFTLISEYILIDGNSKLSCFIFGSDVILTVLIVILMCFPDCYDHAYENFTESKQVYPDHLISGPSRLTFSPAGSFIYHGYNHVLDFDKLWALPKACSNSSSTSLAHSDGKMSNLFWNLIKSTQSDTIASIFGHVFNSVSSLSDPFIVQYLVNAVENHYPLWYLMTVVILSGIYMELRYLLLTRTSYYTSRSYLNVWHDLCNEVYRKMLILSSSSKTKYSAGAIVNLLTTDVDHIKHFWLGIPDYFYTPVLVVSIVYSSPICHTGAQFPIRTSDNPYFHAGERITDPLCHQHRRASNGIQR
uniref:ABC transmembrane type-1 domain-containing protein n=1 Tax=Panagrellus redivivus TaxID=6233 RepID=A0A7E4UXC5_PANRE